jgi:hypothetical protein
MHNPWEPPKKNHHLKGSYDVEPIWNSIPEAHRRKNTSFLICKILEKSAMFICFPELC